MYTQTKDEGKNGMVMKEGPERFWPADLLLYQSATRRYRTNSTRNALTLKQMEEIESSAEDDTTNYQTNDEKVYLLLEMLDVVKV